MRFTFTFYVGRKTITLSIVVKSKRLLHKEKIQVQQPLYG